MNMYLQKDRLEVYVAMDGSDETGDGSFENPYVTVKAAQSAVRAAIRDGGLTEDAFIYIRGGIYYLSEPMTIGIADCDDIHRVVYTSYNDEEVRIVGGIPVTGWADPDGDGIFEADVTGHNNFYALYENGVRLPCAREINWKNKDVRDPSHLQAVYGSATSWFGEVLKVSSLDGDRMTTVYRNCDWSGGVQYLQGAREYIDEAGEWAIEGNKVYYKPENPDILENSEIIAGSVDNIFSVEGEPGHPVKNIVIRGLRLEMNDFGENLLAHARPHNVTAEYDSNLKGLVCLKNTENVTVKNCRMANAGYMAVVLAQYAQNNVIYGNDIRNTGYAGMFLIGDNPGSLNYYNKGNTISNNRIRDVGEFVGHGAGIYLMNSGANRIVHNDISNVPRYGISLKGIRYGVFGDNGITVDFEDHWKYNQTTKNYIGYNKIYNTGIRSGDGGGIEGWGMGRDNHIDHNIVYNAYRGIATNGWRGHSIFLDDAAHHTKVTNNIIYDENAVAVNAGVFIKSINNYVVNNVFDVGYAKNGAADIAPYICPAGGSVFKHNIVYSRSEGTLNGDGTLTDSENSDRIMLYFSDDANSTSTASLDSLHEMNLNLYYNALGSVQFKVNDRLLRLDEWKNDDRNVNRYDADSICEDPLFLDAQNHDYRLSEDSPARKLGIVSIKTAEIGLLSDFRYADNQ